jgi:hypothetical protein
MHFAGTFLDFVIFQQLSQKGISNHNCQSRYLVRLLVEKSRTTRPKALQNPSICRAKNLESDQNDSKKIGSQPADSSFIHADGIKPFDSVQSATSYCS